MKNLLFALLLTFICGTASAFGQIMSDPAQWYINNQIYSTRVFNGMIANSMLRKGARNNAQGRRDQAGKTAPVKDYTAFKESPNGALLKAFAARNNGKTPPEAEKMFDSFIGLYKQTAEKDGFSANDLAYAFEYFIVNNYQLYHDLISLPPEKDPQARKAKDVLERFEILNRKKIWQVTPLQERAVYNQFRTLLAENPEVRQMTDAQKQEATELFAVLFGINFAGYMQGINTDNERLAGEARRMAKEGLEKLLGVPISQIKINENGLEL